MERILKYFPDLSREQRTRFLKMEELYKDWNQKINVVSRKDIEELYLRHVLHSLAIAKFQEFRPGSKILDVGTGGGFPGIPLAILFPEVQFHLVDSKAKKIKVLHGVVKGLELENVKIRRARVEEIDGKFDFIISRAVAKMETFVRWTKGKIAAKNRHDRKNGILYLKGGDLTEELAPFPKAEVYPLNQVFEEEFFTTKKLVYWG